MSRLLAGRIAVVTGASSGLGRATALAFARQGASVVCADLDASAPGAVATDAQIRALGGESLFVATDVAEDGSVEALTRAAVQAYGRIDILVNNAGIASEAAHPRPVWDTPLDVLDRTWRVNVRGAFLGCKHGAAQMRRQARVAEHGRAGTLLNVGSVLGVLGKSGTAAYAASKGAVIALTRAVAMDGAPHGIHCNAILPGFTRTPMIAAMTDGGDVERQLAAGHPLQRLGEPEDIAHAAVFLASSLSNGVTGLNMSVDGGLHAQLGV